MIALDTNILVYAHREDSPWHEAAYDSIQELSEAVGRWAIPWPCLYEFLATVTHPHIYVPPTPLAKALDQVDAWLESPTLVLLGEGSAHWPSLRRILETSRVTGPKVHDARVAALCMRHGVRELWTADRDFSRFPELRVRNPLLPAKGHHPRS